MNIVLRQSKFSNLYQFSDIAGRNYLKFQTKYKEHLKAF